MPSLTSLPAEVISSIHAVAQNPAFLLVHPVIRHSLANPPSSFAARYLISLHEDAGPDEVLVRALKYPICSLAVVKEIEKQWKRGSSRQLSCSELPRRLFRAYKRDYDTLLAHLFDTYRASPNSHKGYPLCRAVLTQDYALISMLLSRGADPYIKSNLPIQVAISMKDIKGVRLLLDWDQPEVHISEPKGRSGRSQKQSSLSPALVEWALNKGSKDIVEYLVNEKGVMPRLHSILRMGR